MKMTKPQTAKHHDLQMMVFATRDVIYRAVADDRTPFNACYAAASQPAQDAYCAAATALDVFEQTTAHAGRAYFDNCGTFRAN